MRKFLIFVFLFALFAAYQLSGFTFAVYNEGGGYTLYFPDGKSADGLSAADSAAMRLTRGASGESVRFKGGDREIERIIKNLDIKITQRQQFANIDTFYGYSPRLGEGVTLGGRRVNVQVARRGDTVTVGTPLIMGSY